MPRQYVICINCGGSGDNYIIGDAKTGEVLKDEKVKLTGLSPFVQNQWASRKDSFFNWVGNQMEYLNDGKIVAAVACGPALKPDVYGQPNRFGIYSIDDAVLDAIRSGYVYTIHPSQLGPLIADEFGRQLNIPVLMRNPISGQMLPDWARLTGIPGVYRRPLGHWLNLEYIFHKWFGEAWKNKNIIGCHFGTGFTIAAFEDGCLINVNDANADGPLSDTRAGGLPSEQLIDWLLAQLTEQQTALDLKSKSTLDLDGQRFKEILQTQCGLAGHLGVRDLEGALELLHSRNAKAQIVYKAMISRIAEEIMRRAANLQGRVDAVILTGGMAKSEVFIDSIKKAIEWQIGDDQISVMGGSFEAAAMVEAAKLVLYEGEIPIEYGPLP